MKLTKNEMVVVGVIILYISFFTHPAPSHITNFLETPMGHIISLLGIAYVLSYQSFIVGLFLGIAYLMTARGVTEYLDEKEQTPKTGATPPPPTPTLTSNGVPPPAVTNALKDLLEKGDTRLPQTQGKTTTEKPPATTEPKASSPAQLNTKNVETFSNF